MAKKVTRGEMPEGGIEEVTFETALARLEAIVGELENGRLGLSDALASYERGVFFLRRCYELLEKAEKKVAVLSGTDAAGRPIVTPLQDEGDGSLEAKAQARSRRRSTDPAPGGGDRRVNKGDENGVDGAGGLF